jgi:hypothetical protein
VSPLPSSFGDSGDPSPRGVDLYFVFFMTSGSERIHSANCRELERCQFLSDVRPLQSHIPGTSDALLLKYCRIVLTCAEVPGTHTLEYRLLVLPPGSLAHPRPSGASPSQLNSFDSIIWDRRRTRVGTNFGSLYRRRRTNKINKPPVAHQ